MQRRYRGRGAIGKITSELKLLAPESVLLVHGKHSYEKSGAKRSLQAILAPYNIVEFCDFSSNPTFDEIMSGIDLLTRNEPVKSIKPKIEAIISVGGGSCIDAAKSINAFLANKGHELAIATGDKKIDKPLLPQIALPTTAGSGSEATHFSVIYVDGQKFSLASPYLLPEVTVLDPNLSQNLPPYITACTGFDALCQAVESYWSKGSNVVSRGYSEKAIRLILGSLKTAVKHPNDTQARENMLYAANFAGQAINISKTTAPHALSYKISQCYGLPHGHAVALTLGRFFRFHEQLIADTTNQSATTLASRSLSLFTLLAVNNATEAENLWYQLMRDCGLNTDLSSIGIDFEGLQAIVTSANFERLANHPVDLTSSMLLGMLEPQLQQNC